MNPEHLNNKLTYYIITLALYQYDKLDKNFAT